MSSISRRAVLQMPAAAGLSAAQQTTPGSGTKPNILFVLVDQMTPFMIGPYGQKIAHTPNLDRLARSGTLFENAYCNSPLCVPSRTSMFSGRLPTVTGGFDNASEFSAHWPTFVHYLRRAGYRTAVAGKCHFIGPDQFHGFDERLTPCIFPAGFSMLPNWLAGPVYNKGTSMQQMLRALGPSKWNRQLAFDTSVFDRSMEYLRRYAVSGAKQPIFLNTAFTQPHDPFTTTQKYLDLYRNVSIPMPHPHDDIRRLSPSYEWFVIHHGTAREKLSPERIQEARRNYLGMISWLDDKVGQMLDELDRLGLTKNTVIIFSSDHGEMLGEYGQWSKRLMLEYSARVPFMIAGPGIPAGKRVSAPVSLLDLFPTLTDIAGQKLETEVDGQSIMPLIDGREDGRDRAVVGEYLGEGPIEPIRMVVYHRHKYIIVNGHAPQLFDLEKDPHETTNVAGRPEYAAIEKELRARAEKNWDGNALKRQVIVSQQQRALVREFSPRWDHNVVVPGNFQF